MIFISTLDYNGDHVMWHLCRPFILFLKTRNVQLEQIITMNFSNKQNGKVPLPEFIVYDSTNLLEVMNILIMDGLKV